MKNNHEQTFVPKLRFPEFAESGEWDVESLGNLSQEIVEKTKGRKYKLMSITSGIGLVSQLEKFGREIAGNSYDNYYVINKGDFAYNKSSTKLYPEGEIAMLEKEEVGAVPNSIFTCFRFEVNKVYSIFAKYPFVNNIHGKWLKKFIAVGARANGALQVNSKDLFSIPFPYPSLPEQEKIAACLTSLDEVLSAESQKLEALKAHKKALLQQLFPAEGETVPTLRFPEFAESGEWEEKKLGEVCQINSGATPLRSNNLFYENGDIPWVKTTDLTNGPIYDTEEKITELAKSRINPVGSVLVAMYGGFNQIGRTGYLKIPAATNQALSVLDPNKNHLHSLFLLMWLNAKVDLWKKFAGSSRKDPNITGNDVAMFPIFFPPLAEQQKIAACLTSLDAVIGLQGERIGALQQHKKGLLQGLFPAGRGE